MTDVLQDCSSSAAAFMRLRCPTLPEAMQLLAGLGVPDAHRGVTAAADDLAAVSVVAHVLQFARWQQTSHTRCKVCSDSRGDSSVQGLTLWLNRLHSDM
jgi:hypothetical protein